MSKYHAQPTTLDGHTFPSLREASRYSELCLLLRAGDITDLSLQVPFPIHVNGTLACTYIADFVYTQDGRRVVEDSKGFRTPIYKLKRKLMKIVRGITILET